MQADVKTAKDIPLSLFMQLKTQYEAEMGKMAATDNSGYESRSYATGRDYGAVATEAGKSCENREFPAGHQECGAGCSKSESIIFIIKKNYFGILTRCRCAVHSTSHRYLRVYCAATSGGRLVDNGHWKDGGTKTLGVMLPSESCDERNLQIFFFFP